jgi:flagellar protein FliL
MSTAAATDAVVPKKGKKKLVIMAAMAALVLAGGGGGAAFWFKQKAAAAAEAEANDDGEATHAKAASHDPKAVPVFVPLEPFTVNLADRDAERYAQIGITLEIEDAKIGEQIKAYMPAIRNNILMAIADKTAAELMDREGKALLADKVRNETLRALGYESAAKPDVADDKPAKKSKKADAAPLPVKAVHFSNFIIQ